MATHGRVVESLKVNLEAIEMSCLINESGNNKLNIRSLASLQHITFFPIVGGRGGVKQTWCKMKTLATES